MEQKSSRRDLSISRGPEAKFVFFLNVFHCFVTSEAPRAATDLSLGGTKILSSRSIDPPWSRGLIRSILCFFAKMLRSRFFKVFFFELLGQDDLGWGVYP